MDNRPAGIWMAGISNSKTIGSISIPGTHDSGGKVPAIEGAGFVQTQRLNIGEQLDAGIRYLDIRCRHISNRFAIHHGVFFLNLFFGEVLNTVCGFLNSNPSETVLMRVKEEHVPRNNTRSFEETFEAYFKEHNCLWEYNGNVDPPLGQLRGKILFIQNFESRKQYGPRLSDFQLQDDFDLDNYNQKKNSIRENMISAQKEGAKMFINHLSAVSIPFINPRAYSAITNPFMCNQIKIYRPDYVGIVVADFPDYRLIHAIIRTNEEFHHKQISSSFLLDQFDSARQPNQCAITIQHESTGPANVLQMNFKAGSENNRNDEKLDSGMYFYGWRK